MADVKEALTLLHLSNAPVVQSDDQDHSTSSLQERMRADPRRLFWLLMSHLCIDQPRLLLQQAFCSQVELDRENDENVKLNRDPGGTKSARVLWDLVFVGSSKRVRLACVAVCPGRSQCTLIGKLWRWDPFYCCPLYMQLYLRPPNVPSLLSGGNRRLSSSLPESQYSGVNFNMYWTSALQQISIELYSPS